MKSKTNLNQTNSCLGLGIGVQTKAHKGTFWDYKNVLYLDYVSDCYIYQACQTISLKWELGIVMGRGPAGQPTHMAFILFEDTIF
jgi:hypothetical protein